MAALLASGVWLGCSGDAPAPQERPKAPPPLAPAATSGAADGASAAADYQYDPTNKRDPFRSYKLTPEDWRNRARWDLYLEAVEEMLSRTSTPFAPWTVVEADDKFYARVKVVRTLANSIEKALR